MNEAYSDIWGETVDQLNNRHNEAPDAPRTAACSKFTRGAVSFTINSPASIAGPCNAVPASFGPVFDATGKTSDLVVGQDGASDGGTTTDGCTTFTNAAAISGRFVYVDRGHCAFAEKVDNADTAGALGIVVGNNDASEAPFSITADADIYGVMIGKADGQRIKSAAGPVNVTIKAGDPEPAGRLLPVALGRGRPCLRRRHQGHVEPHLLRRPREGVGRRVPVLDR